MAGAQDSIYNVGETAVADHVSPFFCQTGAWLLTPVKSCD